MAPTLQPKSGFAFVPMNGLGKPDRSIDRRKIRSHCMRGKNRRIGVPRPLAGHPASQSPCVVSSGNSDDDGLDDQDTILSRPTRITSRRKPSNLSLLKFAFDITNESKALLIDFMHFFSDAMYPAELFIDFDIAQNEWVHWLFKDPAYLQCIFFMAFSTRDLVHNRSITPKTYSHLRDTIIRLNRQLSDANTAVSLGNSTIAVVIMLAMFSCMIDDHAGAKAHISGLHQMVHLRGGLQSFTTSPKLYLKLGRADLVYALNTGANDLLCTYPVANLPLISNIDLPYPSYNSTIIANLSKSLTFEYHIVTIFGEVQHYTSIVNNGHMTRHRRSIHEFHTVICSFEYRLLQLQGALVDTASECLRLTMLAFLITTFQFPGVRARYPYLADRLREACCALRTLTEQKLDIRGLVRWILIVGAISVLDVDTERERWMGEWWRAAVDDTEWNETRAQLKQMMWIDVLQDKIGRAAFEQLNSRR
ncbi:hypothetical protein BDW62DRAFT_105758 [Aspergillus aurantiobrunneus]